MNIPSRIIQGHNLAIDNLIGREAARPHGAPGKSSAAAHRKEYSRAPHTETTRLPEQDKLVVRDCVPLFLDYRNAMFEGLKKKLHEKLAFLVVSLRVAGHPGVCFTDRSLAYGHGHIYHKAEDVIKLHLLNVKEPKGKSIGGVPEVLIPDCVEVANVEQIYHSPKLSRQTLPELPNGISYHGH